MCLSIFFKSTVWNSLFNPKNYAVTDKGLCSQSYGFSSQVWMWELDYKESWVLKNWYIWTVVLEKTWESLRLQGGQTIQSWRKSVLHIHWKDWCWSWSTNTLVTWCEELIHWKRPITLNGHEFEQAPGVGDGQGSLACCSLWDCKELNMTEWLTWVIELNNNAVH